MDRLSIDQNVKLRKYNLLANEIIAIKIRIKIVLYIMILNGTLT